MPQQLTIWQRLQSFLYPVIVRKGSSALNPSLELFYFQGRYALGTNDAIYSDGPKYRPLVKAFSTPQLQASLPGIRKMLVLGTGLASAVHILHESGMHPDATLVDLDPVILEWAEEFLPEHAGQKIDCVHADALEFIRQDAATYDLIIVDIFIGREVPAEAVSEVFLKTCRTRLNPGGHLVLNYMAVAKEMTTKVKAAIEAAFGSVTEISFGLNRVYIATV